MRQPVNSIGGGHALWERYKLWRECRRVNLHLWRMSKDGRASEVGTVIARWLKYRMEAHEIYKLRQMLPRLRPDWFDPSISKTILTISRPYKDRMLEEYGLFYGRVLMAYSSNREAEWDQQGWVDLIELW